MLFQLIVKSQHHLSTPHGHAVEDKACQSDVQHCPRALNAVIGGLHHSTLAGVLMARGT